MSPRCAAVMAYASVGLVLAASPSARGEPAHLPLPPAQRALQGELGEASDASATADTLRLRARSLSGRALLQLSREERLALAHAVASDDSAQTLGHLWLLAHDNDSEVQAAALLSALTRCPKEPASVCSAMMTFFIHEADSQTAWTARTALLAADPAAAMAAAQRAYKLEVLSLIAGRIGLAHLAQGHLRALDVLALDPDPEVQQVACMVLLELSR